MNLPNVPDQDPLVVSGLAASFGRKRLFSGVDLRVGRGELHVLMGENGAGKTTLVECLLGLRRPAAGAIRFFGRAAGEWGRGELYRKVGWVSAAREWYPLHLDVGALLRTVAAFYPTWDKSFAGSLIEAFGLDLRKKLHHLSDGESTKVRLVKALAFRPTLLVLDELTANLSPASAEAVTKAVIALMADDGAGILYVSHSPDEAKRLSDRIHHLSVEGIVC